MKSLRVTESADGVPRATIRVDFRMGLEDLVAAAGYAVEHASGMTTRRHALERLTREEILSALRTSLHEYGETGATVSGENLASDAMVQERLREIARSRVTHLFPEFPHTKEKGGRDG